ncbi:MAG: autotransporter outer membrane beta-barrel domain-containing protein [Halanaerobiales bacterium]|nr:autotransporter outer membrane beta-barrel domain-containing protein [Halanaerobiales bacterium]
MRKILILASLFILVLSFGVSAEKFAFDLEKLDFVGGLTYNNFALEATIDGKEDKDDTEEEKKLKDELANGIGFYAGLRYPLQENIALGVGLDRAASSGSISIKDGSIEMDQSILGPYAEAVYQVNEFIDVSAALAYYQYVNNIKTTVLTDVDELEVKGNGIGFLVGGSYEYPLQDGFALKGSVGYRMATIDLKEETADDKTEDISAEKRKIDLSGFRVSAGISYSF